MAFETLHQISDSLPEGFDFYGFGQVTRSKAKPLSALTEITAGKSGVSFKLLGDPAALLVVLFDSGLDSSMYTELGNILASKLCQSLSEQGEGDLMITPPIVVRAEQLARLSQRNIPFIHQSYEHVDQGSTVLVETLILPILVNGAEVQVGHA